MFCLFLPLPCSVKEHFMQHHQLVGSSETPPGVFVQKEFRVCHSLQLSIGYSLLFGPFTGHLGPLHSPSVLQGQKCGITREINITKICLSITVKMHNCVSCYPIKRCRSTVLEHHLPTSQFLKPYPHFITLPFLTQTSPDHLSN